MQHDVSRIKAHTLLLGLLAFCCFLSACASSQDLPTTPLALQDSATPEIYLIGADDVVDIQVWKNPDLSRVVTVRPDGKLSLPLLGDIQAAGLTPQQLSESVVDRLKEYYKEPPQVSVIVQQINSYTIYVLGEVRNPGKFVVKSGTSVVQAIAMAGGFSQFASRNKMRILRRQPDNKETFIPIRYKDILAGRQANVMLRPNDSIIVP